MKTLAPADSTQFACFNRFEIGMPLSVAESCSHQGQYDEDVAHWAPRIARPEGCTASALVAELCEYGAWDADELLDDEANWRRIIWLAAGNILDEVKSS